MIDIIDASSATGALRAAEEVGWARGMSVALDILTAAARTATPAEMVIIHQLALEFSRRSADAVTAIQAMRDALPTAKGAA
jgi:hypothetical protein